LERQILRLVQFSGENFVEKLRTPEEKQVLSRWSFVDSHSSALELQLTSVGVPTTDP